MEEIPIIKDISFWHILATTSCGIVIKMLYRYIEDNKKTLERITDILNSVVTKNEVQEVKIDQHEKRLEKLEGRL